MFCSGVCRAGVGVGRGVGGGCKVEGSGEGFCIRFVSKIEQTCPVPEGGSVVSLGSINEPEGRCFIPVSVVRNS